jgi:two-component system sensor histidine kinase LytS
MAERMGIIIAIAFLFTRWSRFRNLLDLHPNNSEKLMLSLTFGFFGIIGTYTGITITPGEVQHQFPGYLSFEDAIANSRAISVMVAGLLGGPITGLGAGLIAGLHRWSLGGFTGIACTFSTVFEGLLAGLVYQRMKHSGGISATAALYTGIVGEMGQMVIILLIAQPFAKAVALVEIIALPMILANSFGIALFIAIVQAVVENERRIGAIQAQKALTIADKTLSYLRTGLNPKSAHITAEIIYKESDIAAVAITDKTNILAHVGKGSDHHLAGSPILTGVTKQVLSSGTLSIATSPEEILCEQHQCPLQSAIVAPLKSKSEVVGTLKLYFANRKSPDKFMIELANGLAHLFSTQLELSEAEKQARLLQNAEIKALQAQINPHFLFNSLNTVVSLIRTNPDQARHVLVNLSSYIRQNLNSSLSTLTSLETELKHVQAYLSVVQARFSNRLQITVDIPEQLLSLQVPPLTLQPLVENAVQHGFKKITEQSTVYIGAKKEGAYVKIVVQDNGVGIPQPLLAELLDLDKRKNSQSIGLINVHSRLLGIFGPESGLKIISTPNEGTTISFKLLIEDKN